MFWIFPSHRRVSACHEPSQSLSNFRKESQSPISYVNGKLLEPKSKPCEACDYYSPQNGLHDILNQNRHRSLFSIVAALRFTLCKSSDLQLLCPAKSPSICSKQCFETRYLKRSRNKYTIDYLASNSCESQLIIQNRFSFYALTTERRAPSLKTGRNLDSRRSQKDRTVFKCDCRCHLEYTVKRHTTGFR